MAKRQAGETNSGQERRAELVRIAHRHIAEKGFEGLRIREVAAEAGINNATLHYYFPTKEALIQGVVDHLLDTLRSVRYPGWTEAAETPLNRLRAEFEDLRYRFLNMPEMFVVMAELAIRSHRDPIIARILKEVDESWRGYLVGILESGMRQGDFRPDLDAVATATAIMVQLKSIGYQATVDPNAEQIDRLVSQIAAQVERWVAQDN